MSSKLLDDICKEDSLNFAKPHQGAPVVEDRAVLEPLLDLDDMDLKLLDDFLKEDSLNFASVPNPSSSSAPPEFTGTQTSVATDIALRQPRDLLGSINPGEHDPISQISIQPINYDGSTTREGEMLREDSTSGDGGMPSDGEQPSEGEQMPSEDEQPSEGEHMLNEEEHMPWPDSSSYGDGRSIPSSSSWGDGLSQSTSYYDPNWAAGWDRSDRPVNSYTEPSSFGSAMDVSPNPIQPVATFAAPSSEVGNFGLSSFYPALNAPYFSNLEPYLPVEPFVSQAFGAPGVMPTSHTSKFARANYDITSTYAFRGYDYANSESSAFPKCLYAAREPDGTRRALLLNNVLFLIYPNGTRGSFVGNAVCYANTNAVILSQISLRHRVRLQ